ncbi:MAG: TIGR03032 family protein [Paracoccaceae bacterium]
MTTETADSVDTADGQAKDAAGPKLELRPSRMFAPWLASTGSSLGFTTYQAGKVFLIGSNAGNGQLSVYERSFARCMGLGSGPDGAIWLSSLYQLWRFENFLEPGQNRDGYDAIYVPLEGRTTGDVDIHDVHPLGPGQSPVFVVTRFNCLATLDRANSFAPLWKPPFIDRIAAEDRCHLNGLAMRDGVPAYVTCVSRTNVAGAWREHRQDGGMVLDVATGEPVATGLTMPHSPRLHNGQLYIIQSGTGEFGRVDITTGAFEPMCFLPGFARGVCFIGHHAVIGVSRPRREKTFEGLALDDRLATAGASPTCMLAVVNLETGDMEHSLEISGAVQELYDVTTLAGVRRPMILGFRTPEIRFMIRPAPLGTDGG